MTPARDIVGDDKAERPPLPPGDARHGTANGYHNLRCRCDACRKAWATHIAKRKAERPPLPPGDARHGTVNGYLNLKCRCDACRKAWATCIAKRRAERPPLPPGDARHGTTNGYANLKCRCDACRKAWATCIAKRKAERRTSPIPDSVEHGRCTTYSNWSCRCSKCLDAVRRRGGHLPQGFRATSDVTLPTPPPVVKRKVQTWLYLNSAMSGRSLREITGSDGRPPAHPARRRGTKDWSIDYLDSVFPDATRGAA